MPGRQFAFRRRPILPSKAVCDRKATASTVVLGIATAVLLVAGCSSTASKSSTSAVSSKSSASHASSRHVTVINSTGEYGAIYRIGGSSAYGTAFHAITTGTNTVKFPEKTITGYAAASGWNPVTGWGSPNAQVLIPLLIRYAQ